MNGIRHIPTNLIDVAGLVPGAHLGKGRGNQFLNDLVNADVLIQVVDVSGRTDVEGAPCTGCDPSTEVKMIQNEMAEWLAEIILRHKNTLIRGATATSLSLNCSLASRPTLIRYAGLRRRAISHSRT